MASHPNGNTDAEPVAAAEPSLDKPGDVKVVFGDVYTWGAAPFGGSEVEQVPHLAGYRITSIATSCLNDTATAITPAAPNRLQWVQTRDDASVRCAAVFCCTHCWWFGAHHDDPP